MIIKNITCFCFLFFVSCSKKSPPAAPPVPVTAMQVIAQTIPADFQYIGVAESSHIVELRARVEGYLEQIAYKEGALVKTNELMFVLDQRPFIDSVAMAQGEVDRQRALLWNAQQTKARMIPLYEQNAVSQKDYDQAIAAELAAEADLDVADAHLQKAELNLSFASIHAPVTGMASQAKFREGALIAPGPDSLLTMMYVIDPIWVNFCVSEGDILKARSEVSHQLLVYPPNMNFKIEIMLADSTILPAEGVIDFTDPAMQQSTGTMLVRSVVPNPNGWLRPGQFVRVVVKGAIRPNAILVPQTAVQQGQNGIFVYVINPAGKAEVRPITPGDWYQDSWIIESGLNPGDIVVTMGVNRVQNGTAVHIINMVPSRSPTSSSTDAERDQLGL
jgi:membrane fusion protein, multidrug efflux system